jgi:hypothetical protein
VTAAVGDWNAELEEDEEPVVVVEVVADGTALVPGAAAAGEVVGDAAAGGLTANCDPVTTVTWAPSVVGPRAVMTAPDSVVDDGLRFGADRRGVADPDHVEPERLQGALRVGGLVVGAGSVEHGDRYAGRGGELLAGHGVGVGIDPEELVDDLLVLGGCGELDVAVGSPLVLVRAELVHLHGKGELRRRVHVDRMEVEHQVDHVRGRELAVDVELGRDATDQLLVGDRIGQAVLRHR